MFMLFTKKRKRLQTLVSCFLCLTLVMTNYIGLVGTKTAEAAVSPLITSYKPQVVNADANVSYVDGNGNTISGILHHPGIVMSQAALDNMRDHVRAGDEPWNTAFETFASDPRSSKNPRILYEGNYIFIHVQGPWAFTDPDTGNFYSNPSDYVGTRANRDSETAFMQAIMWYITGDETYRSNAMTIIRDYAAIQDCVTHTSFRFATATYMFGAAAEILRYSDTPTQSLKWAASDTTNLTNMMDILSVTYDAHYFFMNQHQFTVGGTMARAIFKNDYALYAEAVEAATVNSSGDQGGRNGSIKYQMRWMTENEVTGAPLDPADYHVQAIEMGRDVGHSYADVAGLSTLAQMIYAQGTLVDPVTGAMSTASNAVNVFNFLDDRLLEGSTYVLKYHLGYDELWTPAWANQSSSIQYFDTINADLRGRIDPFFSVLYNYYKYIQKVDMSQEKYKYLAYTYETKMPEVAGKDYPLASLLFTPDAAKTDGMSNQITLGSITGLTATSAGSDKISLSWTPVPKALGYNIYRSTDPNGTFTKINSVPVPTASYSDTGLTPNTIYYYKIGVSGGSTSDPVSTITGGTGTPALDASSYTLIVNDTHNTVLSILYPDRSTQDLTGQASYSSSNTAVATVDSAGVVRGIGVGTATITAAYNGQNYNATVQVISDTNLKAWLKFDETSGTTAADSSGYGNSGTFNGGTSAAWTTGNSGNAVDLDGTDDYMALPAGVVSSLDTATVAAWVNLDAVTNWMRIFDFGSGTTNYMYLSPKNGANGKIRFAIKVNGSSDQVIDGQAAVATGGWHHIAVTLNGATGTLYVDGTQVGQNTAMTFKPSDLGATTQNWIGRSQFSDPYLNGRVDDFRIYNRALSSTEVTSMMNGQALTTVPTAPTGVTAAASDSSSVNLSWSAVTGATGYNVYMATSSAVNAVYTKANTDVITGTAFTSAGLKANTTYYYKVKAVNAVGESGTSVIASAATATNMPDASLIAWYKFNESSGTTAVDSSGNGNNGTINGGTNATWATGKYGNAVSFGGTNTTAAYVSLPGNIVDNLTSMTIASWVNTSNPGDFASLFTAGPAAAGTPTKYMMFQPRGSRFMITANGSTAEQNISTGSNLAANTWKHIVITLSGSTGTLYIDGVQVAQNTSMTWKPSDLAPTSSGNFIGKSEWNADKYLKGQVDDFRIYNRAISASEVTSVMNGLTLTTQAVPTGVSARAVSGTRVNLAWTAASNATGYNIKRATVSGGPYTTIATSITGTSYTDTGLTAGTAYYYVVSAVNPDTESANSTEAGVTLPISQLKFDETSGTTAADATGSGWNGTLVGGPLWGSGRTGNAVDLDGTNDYVALPTGVVSNATTSTISAWVNLDAVSNWMRIFDFGSGTSTYMFLSPKNGANGKIRFAIKLNGSAEQIIDGQSALPTGGWHHVAVTLNGATGTLYVDGQQVGSNTAMTLKPSDLGATTQNWIGRSQFADPFLNGRVDDFRIYSKALGSNEVAVLANLNAAPQNLTAAANLQQTTLSWSPVANAAGYNIKRAAVSGGPYVLIGTGTTGTSYTDTTVSAGTTYYYVVSAVHSDYESDNSAEAGAFVLDAPQNLTVSNVLLQTTLSWSPVANAASYTIKRATASGGGPYATIATGITGTSYTDTGLTVGTTYYYVVSAVNGSNESMNAAEASAKVNLLQTYLKFDETSGTTAADATGSGWNGTLVNGPIWTAGKSGNAVDLDGTNDHVALPAGVVSNANTGTIAAWVNLDNVSNWMRIFDFGSGTSNYMFLTPKNGVNGKIRFAVKLNGSTEQIIDGQAALPTGGWHHVAVVLNGATGILYVDGVQVGSNTTMTIKPSDLGNTTQNWIGRSQFSDPYLDGRVDEFCIYTRVLTSGEIAALAQQ
jgi:fibronectin type 3 domain-containing protein